MKNYFRVLTIAGSDSCGGAGIQADLKTFCALGCYGMSAITALTAQNTQGVVQVLEVSPQFVGAQLDAVLGDIAADAVKIGMLLSAQIVEVVASQLRFHQVSHVVVDPVMVAKSGDLLLQRNAIRALKEHLLPLATLITPNLPEASVLLSRNISRRQEMEDAAQDLANQFRVAVLLKGGHLDATSSDDVYFDPSTGELKWFSGVRVQTKNTHGTGCTLSSAIAAGLAQGCSLPDAIARAKIYLTGAIASGAEYRFKGHGPVHHFFELWS